VQEHSGIVVDRLSQRKAELVEMKPVGGQNRIRLVFTIPSRGLIGYQSEFRNSTRGTGVLTRLFKGYDKFKGAIDNRRNGSLISSATGTTVSYALESLQDRGVLFLAPGAKVYEGMIVGENSRDNDLEVRFSNFPARLASPRICNKLRRLYNSCLVFLSGEPDEEQTTHKHSCCRQRCRPGLSRPKHPGWFAG
jgi:predicted membrane GTPase involved in stress response